jgi:hypothetical protein
MNKFYSRNKLFRPMLSVDISGCHDVDNAAIMAITEACTSLKSLILADCIGLDDEALTGFYQKQTVTVPITDATVSLDDVDAEPGTAAPPVDKDGKPILTKRITRLKQSSIEEMSLSMCKMTNVGIEIIGECFGKLRKLDLSRTLVTGGFSPASCPCTDSDGVMCDVCECLRGGAVWHRVWLHSANLH